jgi:hypothetical protein
MAPLPSCVLGVSLLWLVAAAPTTRSTAPAEHVGDMYYLDTCAVCTAKLGAKGDAILRYYDRRSVRFCQKSCQGEFERDPAEGTARLDARMTRDQLPRYPLTTSVVSGVPLGERPLDWFWGNRLVRLADASEKERFLAQPDRYIEALDAACIARQAPAYAFAKCPVQGDILPGDEVEDVVVANRMVRVCCHRCVDSVGNRPVQYLAVVDYANRQAAERRRR